MPYTENYSFCEITQLLEMEFNVPDATLLSFSNVVVSSLILHPFQIASRFDFSRFINIIMHLDTMYV